VSECVCVCVCVFERERDRDRDTERERERETDRQKDRQTDRHRERRGQGHPHAGATGRNQSAKGSPIQPNHMAGRNHSASPALAPTDWRSIGRRTRSRQARHLNRSTARGARRGVRRGAARREGFAGNAINLPECSRPLQSASFQQGANRPACRLAQRHPSND
jgi:hypothetical protein